MKGQTYIKGVSTLQLNIHKCTGCGMCVTVCPHRVFLFSGGKAGIVDRDLCMECGACALNCPVDAIEVSSGVGCAAAVLTHMFKGGDLNCDCCCSESKPPPTDKQDCC